MLRQVMRLVKHGVPYHEAWAMSPARRLALIVVCGELDGGTFNWKNLSWERAAS